MRLVIIVISFLLITSCAPTLAPEQPQPFRGTVTIHFIDVGQGDAVLIQGPGGQNVLYDGGRNDTDALGYLQTLGIQKLDLVIASHPDADHIGGLDAVIDVYAPAFYMDNGVVSTTQTYQDVLESVQNAGSQLVEPTGQTITLGDAVLQIIPPPPEETLSRNNRSIAVLLSFGAFAVALTGDAEAEEFAYWQTMTPTLLKEVDIYKASHHGSKNGDTPESIAAWNPEVVVIGVSATNPFGHPTAEALELYQGVGAVVYRTDLDGDIVVTGSSDGTYGIGLNP